MSTTSVSKPRKQKRQADPNTAKRGNGNKKGRRQPVSSAIMSQQPGPTLALTGVQTKVTIGPVDDPFEQEANRVAEHVVSDRLAPQVSRIGTGGVTQRQPADQESVQTQAEEEPIQTQSEGETPVQREGESRDGRPSGGSAGMRAAAAHAIHTKGSGQPLAQPIQSRLERSLKADLSDVRVHTDMQAASANRKLKSRAFTHGRDIWLGKGESANDLRLMGHEATHVLQQDGVVRRQLLEPAVEEPLREMAPDLATQLLEGATGENSENQETAPASTLEAFRSERTLPPIDSLEEEVAEPTSASASEVTAAPVAEAEAVVSESAIPEAAAQVAPETNTEESRVARPTMAEREAAAALLPEMPTGLSESDQADLNRVQGRVRQTAHNESNVPSAATNTTGARESVTEPDTEVNARAQAELITQLGEQAEPSPEIEALCNRIKELIESQRPPDEESLLQHNPEAAANAAGSQLNSNIEGEAEAVNSSYGSLEEDPEGTPSQIGQEPERPAEEVSSPEIGANSAAPTPLTEEETSFAGAVTESEANMRAAGIDPDSEVVAESARGGGPHADAIENQEALESEAAESQEAIQARQSEAIASAQNNMAALQAQALEALNSSRRSNIDGAGNQQREMATQETQTREGISRQANEIFTNAQTTVNGLLEPLSSNAMQRWNTEKARLSGEFEATLSRVDDWIADRHSGVLGGVVAFFDNTFGYPGWIVDEYDRAERQFGDGVCKVLRDISREVNSVIASCEEIITNAQREIDSLFTNLPADLADWAQGEQARFQERIAGLRSSIAETRDNINQDLSQEASQAVDTVRQEIHSRREAAGGLIGRIAAAVEAFIEDPVRAIVNGLLTLVGIEPSRFWALVNRIGQVVSDIAADPLGFAGNLLEGIGQGFQRFFDNFKDHVIGGFFEWLFSGLGSVGVEIPRDFSLKSLITFLLQLMGITWARIRRLLAKHIGEENVALIEQAWQIVSTLIEQGPEGIFEMIKEQLNPQEILNQILDAAIDFMIDALIKLVTPRIVLLFNPVGAVAQAIEAIYKVLKWIFENAARLFTFVESVVNAMADVVAGNLGGVAAKVEDSLRLLVAPVIDFLMGFVGLGDLPDKIADTIRGFQNWIENILDRVIGWLAAQGRRLLSALGLRQDEDSDPENQEQYVSIDEDFKTDDGTEHHLLIEEGSDEQLILRSNPMSYKQFLSSLKENDSGENRSTIDSANEIVSDFYKERSRQYTENQKSNLKDAKKEKKTNLEGILERLWVKTNILLEGQGDVPTGDSPEDPILIDWYKTLDDNNLYPNIEYTGADGEQDAQTIYESPVFLDHPLTHEIIPFGLTSEWKSKARNLENGTPFQKSRGDRGRNTEILRSLLTYLNVDLSYFDLDHVFELNFGGEDDFGNIWPLDRSANRSAGSAQNSQIVTYKDTQNNQIRAINAGNEKLNNKWFKVNQES